MRKKGIVSIPFDEALHLEFEFDPDKSQANRAKHGIDFVEAQALWLDDRVLEVRARTNDEPRFLVVGKINAVFWSGVITYRDNRVRFISVRRSRKAEIELYESQDF